MMTLKNTKESSTNPPPLTQQQQQHDDDDDDDDKEEEEECLMPLSLLSIVSKHSNQPKPVFANKRNVLLLSNNTRISRQQQQHHNNNNKNNRSNNNNIRRLVQVEEMDVVSSSIVSGDEKCISGSDHRMHTYMHKDNDHRRNVTSELPRGQYEVMLRPRYLYRKIQEVDCNGDRSEQEKVSRSQRRALFPKLVDDKDKDSNEVIRSLKKDEDMEFDIANNRGISIFGHDFDEDQDENDFVTEYDGAVEDLSLGMKLTILGGFVIVQEVAPLTDGRASPAQISGSISRGDVLVAINGKVIIGMQFLQLSEALKALPFTQYQKGKQKIRLRFVVGEGNTLLESNEVLNKSLVRNILPLTGGDGNSLVDIFFPSDFPMVDQLSGMPLFGDTQNTYQRESGEYDSPKRENSTITRIRDDDSEDTKETHVEIISTSDRLQRIASHVFGVLNDEHLHGVWKSGFYDLDETTNDLLRHKTKQIQSVGGSIVDKKESEKVLLSLPDRCLLGKDAIAGAGVLFDVIEISTSAIYGNDIYQKLPVHMTDELGANALTSRLYDLAREEEFYSTVLRVLEAFLRLSDDDSEKKQENYLTSIFQKARNPLPPLEITAALYDMAIKKLANENMNDVIYLSLTKDCFRDLDFVDLGDEVACTKKGLRSFIINKALPIWLRTFHPVTCQDRKLIWSLDKMASNLLDDTASEVIVKEHATLLIKFYFDNVAKETPYEQIVEFLDTYGSYLDLNSALMTIGRVGKVMGNIIPLLLKIAKYDPLHLQSAKDHTYNGKPVLSSVIENLKELIENKNYPLLVKCFPELNSWQVEEASGGKESNGYYEYLTELLDHREGSYSARLDADLVATWCILSAKSGTPECLSNLKVIVSDTGSKSYARDLSLLMELSMTMKLDDCALDVCEEFITTYENNKNTNMNMVFQNLRLLARRILRAELESNGSSIVKLRRVFHCWNDLSELKLKKEHILRIPNEISSLFDDVVSLEPSILSFITIISNEIPPLIALSAFQLIHSLSKAKRLNFHRHLITPLKLILTRSITEARLSSSERSLVLYRIERMRQFQRNNMLYDSLEDDSNQQDNNSVMLWDRIGDGTVSINK